MTLHTVGPANMAEDEHKIGDGYKVGWAALYGIAPFVIAHYFDMKYLVAAGLAAILVNLHEAGGRLHDLCIRLRRTNIMLRDMQPDARPRMREFL